MTATAEQAQSDLVRLVSLAQQGEEVVITDHGRAVARLSSVAQPVSSPDRKAWLAQLADPRRKLATGRSGPSIEQLLDEDRGE